MSETHSSDLRSSKVPPLLYNWTSLIGIILAGSSFFAILCLMGWNYIRGSTNPYVGVVTYVLFPGFLWVGIMLMTLGAWRERRRRRKLAPTVILEFPRIDFNLSRHRRRFVQVVLLSFLLFLFTGFGTYRSYEVTESVVFCGRLCHSVMKPEYTAYSTSPHARVKCVECHIGPGASWFVRSKLSGLYQVYATIAKAYPRPIPVPVQNLRPAEMTCEQCHWPEKFYGAVELMHTNFLPDHQNSPWTIRMLLKVGGSNPARGPVGGIHWHIGADHLVEYIPKDAQRQAIPWIRVTDTQGRVTIYQAEEDKLTPEQIAQGIVRRMDCVDCHNRPTHIFRSPYEALDMALWLNHIDPSIPSIKVNAATALLESFQSSASQAEGEMKIAEKLNEDYAERKGDPRILKAIVETQKLFHDNFFPGMKTDWRVRPNNIGHWVWPGCFRCHDGRHLTDTGVSISHKCDVCHTITGQGPGTDLQSISAKGLDFQHPGGELPEGVNCNECHTGGP